MRLPDWVTAYTTYLSLRNKVETSRTQQDFEVVMRLPNLAAGIHIQLRSSQQVEVEQILTRF